MKVWAWVRRKYRALRRRMVAADVGDADGATEQPMAGTTLQVLVVFLLLVLAWGSWLSWTVWSARPAPVAEVAWPSSTPVDPVDGQPPSVSALSPGSIVYGVGRPAVRLLGTGFSEASTVLVDGRPHPGGSFIAPDQMILLLGDDDFRQSGVVAVSVTRDDLRSRPVALRIDDGTQVQVAWSPIPGQAFSISVESRLLLLVVLVGALGGTLASFNSLSDYRGEGRLTRSWTLYYVLSPILGGGIALLLYAVVRAGFLSGTDVRIEASSAPWGLVAVSGLAGLFYDKALLKLREIFVTLFNPRDERGGKLVPPAATTGGEALEIVKDSLPPATKGTWYEGAIEAEGGTPPYSWSVTPDLPGGLSLDPLSGAVSGKPVEASAAQRYEFRVEDMARRSGTVTVELEVRP